MNPQPVSARGNRCVQTMCSGRQDGRWVGCLLSAGGWLMRGQLLNPVHGAVTTVLC